MSPVVPSAFLQADSLGQVDEAFDREREALYAPPPPPPALLPDPMQRQGERGGVQPLDPDSEAAVQRALDELARAADEPVGTGLSDPNQATPPAPSPEIPGYDEAWEAARQSLYQPAPEPPAPAAPESPALAQRMHPLDAANEALDAETGQRFGDLPTATAPAAVEIPGYDAAWEQARQSLYAGDGAAYAPLETGVFDRTLARHTTGEGVSVPPMQPGVFDRTVAQSRFDPAKAAQETVGKIPGAGPQLPVPSEKPFEMRRFESLGDAAGAGAQDAMDRSNPTVGPGGLGLADARFDPTIGSLSLDDTEELLGPVARTIGEKTGISDAIGGVSRAVGRATGGGAASSAAPDTARMASPVTPLADVPADPAIILADVRAQLASVPDTAADDVRLAVMRGAVRQMGDLVPGLREALDEAASGGMWARSGWDKFVRAANDALATVPDDDAARAARQEAANAIPPTATEEAAASQLAADRARSILDRVAELDNAGAPDSAYQEVLSTGSKQPLGPGETWRGRALRFAGEDAVPPVEPPKPPTDTGTSGSSDDFTHARPLGNVPTGTPAAEALQTEMIRGYYDEHGTVPLADTAAKMKVILADPELTDALMARMASQTPGQRTAEHEAVRMLYREARDEYHRLDALPLPTDDDGRIVHEMRVKNARDLMMSSFIADALEGSEAGRLLRAMREVRSEHEASLLISGYQQLRQLDSDLTKDIVNGARKDMLTPEAVSKLEVLQGRLEAEVNGNGINGAAAPRRAPTVEKSYDQTLADFEDASRKKADLEERVRDLQEQVDAEMGPDASHFPSQLGRDQWGRHGVPNPPPASLTYTDVDGSRQTVDMRRLSDDAIKEILEGAREDLGWKPGMDLDWSELDIPAWVVPAISDNPRIPRQWLRPTLKDDLDKARTELDRVTRQMDLLDRQLTRMVQSEDMPGRMPAKGAPRGARTAASGTDVATQEPMEGMAETRAVGVDPLVTAPGPSVRGPHDAPDTRPHTQGTLAQDQPEAPKVGNEPRPLGPHEPPDDVAREQGRMAGGLAPAEEQLDDYERYVLNNRELAQLRQQQADIRKATDADRPRLGSAKMGDAAVGLTAKERDAAEQRLLGINDRMQDLATEQRRLFSIFENEAKIEVRERIARGELNAPTDADIVKQQAAALRSRLRRAEEEAQGSPRFLEAEAKRRELRAQKVAASEAKKLNAADTKEVQRQQREADRFGNALESGINRALAQDTLATIDRLRKAGYDRADANLLLRQLQNITLESERVVRQYQNQEVQRQARGIVRRQFKDIKDEDAKKAKVAEIAHELDLVDWSDPRAAVKFAERFEGGGKLERAWRFVHAHRVASMLSGSASMLINVLGGVAETGWRFPVAATRDLMHGDVGLARTHGEWEGLTRTWEVAWKDFNTTLTSGYSSRPLRDIKGSKADIGPGGALNPFNDVFRILSASDDFMRTLNTGMALRARASAIARAEPTPRMGDPRFSKATSVPNKMTVEWVLNNPVLYPEVVEGAAADGLRATYQDELTGAFKYLDMARTNPVGQIIVPFFRTVVKMAHRGAGRTPYGFAEAAWAAHKGDMDTAERKAAEAIAGSILMVPAAMAFAADKLTGMAPANDAERQDWADQGKTAWSFKLGDRWVPYGNWGAFAVPLAMAAVTSQALRDGMDPLKAEKALGEFIGGMGNFWLNTLAVRGMLDFSRAITEPERYGEQFVEGIATSFTTPGATATLARMLDTGRKDPEGVMEAILARTPVLSKQVPNQQTQLGEDRTLGTEWWQAGSPIRAIKEAPDPILQEYQRVRAAGFPVSLGTDFDTVDGAKLTREEQTEFGRILGEQRRDKIGTLIATTSYQFASAEEQAKKLALEEDRARKAAVSAFKAQTGWRKELATAR